jgi:hypothetical protein
VALIRTDVSEDRIASIFRVHECTLSLCSSLNVRDQVSHPYRTTGKIIVLYILICMFFDSRRENERFWAEW